MKFATKRSELLVINMGHVLDSPATDSSSMIGLISKESSLRWCDACSCLALDGGAILLCWSLFDETFSELFLGCIALNLPNDGFPVGGSGMGRFGGSLCDADGNIFNPSFLISSFGGAGGARLGQSAAETKKIINRKKYHLFIDLKARNEGVLKLLSVYNLAYVSFYKRW